MISPFPSLFPSWSYSTRPAAHPTHPTCLKSAVSRSRCSCASWLKDPVREPPLARPKKLPRFDAPRRFGGPLSSPWAVPKHLNKPMLWPSSAIRPPKWRSMKSSAGKKNGLVRDTQRERERHDGHTAPPKRRRLLAIVCRRPWCANDHDPQRHDPS